MIVTYEGYDTAPDDGAALQASIDAQIAAGYTEIVLPPGDYRLSDPLRFSRMGLYIITDGVIVRLPRADAGRREEDHLWPQSN